eukprot:3757483-Rhodomonas_salina.1
MKKSFRFRAGVRVYFCVRAPRGPWSRVEGLGSGSLGSRVWDLGSQGQGLVGQHLANHGFDAVHGPQPKGLGSGV